MKSKLLMINVVISLAIVNELTFTNGNTSFSNILLSNLRVISILLTKSDTFSVSIKPLSKI